MSGSLGYLQYIDPREIWDLVIAAKRATGCAELKDPRLWQHVYDALLRAGASPDHAERWRSGLRLIAGGSCPKGTS